MKKLISLFLCLCLMAGIMPAVADYTLHAVESAEFPLYCPMISEDPIWNMKLYFLNGANDLPYVELHV